MADEPHEVVKLLLARMESHPEEFRLKDPSYHDRWYNHMSAINTYGNEADKAALAAKVRDIRMGVIHEEVMEELLNGEDRRRKEEEDREYEQTMIRQGLLAQQQKAYVGQLQGMVGQVYGGSGGGGGGGGGVMGTPTAATPKPSPYDKIMNALKKGK